MGRKAPTLVAVATVGLPKLDAPRPSGSRATWTESGPTVVEESWKETSTWPLGPMAMFPKLPSVELGTLWTAPKLPITPRPDTGAPAASRSPLLNTTQTEPAPVATLGWSWAGKSP